MPERREYRPRAGTPRGSIDPEVLEKYTYITALMSAIRDSMNLLQGIDLGTERSMQNLMVAASSADRLSTLFRNLSRESLPEVVSYMEVFERSLERVRRRLYRILQQPRTALTELQQVLEEGLTAEEMATRAEEIFGRISPSARQTLFGEENIQQLIESLRTGQIDRVQNYLEMFQNRLERYEGYIRTINRDLSRLRRITPELLETVAVRIDSLGKEMRGILSSFATRLADEAGLSSLVRGVGSIVAMARTLGSRAFLLWGALEAILGAYRLWQSLYMEMRRTVPVMTFPGAGVAGFAGQTEQLGVNLTLLLEGVVQQIHANMNRAFYDLRISQQDYLNILNRLKSAGIGVEATLEGIRISTAAAEGKFFEVSTTMDEFVRRLYTLSYATGMSVESLVRGATQLMQLTGDREFYRTLDTFVALNEIATRLHISGERFASWVLDATQNLRLFGYSVSNVSVAVSRHAEALYRGIVSIQELSRAVRQFTGQSEQMMSLGFFGALRDQGDIGEFLRRIVQEMGIGEAFAVYRLLVSNSVESIVRASRDASTIVGQTARYLLRRIQEFEQAGGVERGERVPTVIQTVLQQVPEERRREVLGAISRVLENLSVMVREREVIPQQLPQAERREEWVQDLQRALSDFIQSSFRQTEVLSSLPAQLQQQLVDVLTNLYTGRVEEVVQRGAEEHLTPERIAELLVREFNTYTNTVILPLLQGTPQPPSTTPQVQVRVESEEIGDVLERLIREARMLQVRTPLGIVGEQFGPGLRYMIEQQLFGQEILSNNLWRATETFGFVLDTLQQNLESMSSKLDSLSGVGGQIYEGITDLLESTKSLSQYVQNIEANVRGIASTVLQGRAVPPPMVPAVVPRSR